jgi:hypothetical protein
MKKEKNMNAIKIEFHLTEPAFYAYSLREDKKTLEIPYFI